MKKRKYNPACAEDEVSISDMLNEELGIVSGDEMNLENEGQIASEESSSTSSESECESETSVVCIDGWEGVTMGDKKSNAYTFTKNEDYNFTYQMQSPWIIFVYFSMTSFCITLL
jgi:hypothetical protein